MSTSPEASSSRFPTVKVTALARLKSFADTLTSRRGKSDLIFPPPSWEIDKLVIDRNNERAQERSESPPGAETAADLAETVVSTEVPISEPSDPERLTFAQRIRELIESLPLPGTPAPTRQLGADDTTENRILNAQDGSVGPPASPGVDRDLVDMLSSEQIMNGDEEEKGKGKAEQPSIWGVLAGMRWTSKDKEASHPRQEPSESVDGAQGGLMMYAPLEPTNESQVELAEIRPATDVPTEPDSQPNSQPIQELEWVPSTTNISLYTTWWGYRMYLPPPVMKTLDSKSLKATAQAAMVTSALKWLLNHVPNTLVPAQFKIPLQLLKRLSPMVGYIGVFVAWSWGRIKSHDKGNGVVLTATWLLPVALIPMAWNAGDIFGPVLLPKPEDQKAAPSQEEAREVRNDESKTEQETGKKGRKGFWSL